VKQWSPKFEVGQALRFRLQANPTFAQTLEGQTNNKGMFKNVRRGLYREAERLDWLRRQSARYGFELSLIPTTLRAKDEKQVLFRGKGYDELSLELPMCEVIDLNDGRRFPVPSSSNQFSAARFDGVLRVTDAEAFANAVENGIGKARGYGFGLLSVAPASK
jgi:CRISPR system Cascade subunit CasE